MKVLPAADPLLISKLQYSSLFPYNHPRGFLHLVIPDNFTVIII